MCGMAAVGFDRKFLNQKELHLGEKRQRAGDLAEEMAKRHLLDVEIAKRHLPAEEMAKRYLLPIEMAKRRLLDVEVQTCQRQPEIAWEAQVLMQRQRYQTAGFDMLFILDWRSLA